MLTTMQQQPWSPQPSRQPYVDPEPQFAPGGPGAYNSSGRHSVRAELNAGVERFMAGVFGWMALGVGVTAGVAAAIASVPDVMFFLFSTPLWWVVFLAPLPMAWYLGARIHTLSPRTAAAMFFVYAALIGVALSPIPYIYSAASITGIFLVSAIMFAGLAAFGYFTRIDLGVFGRFLTMALFGLLAAWLVSLFVPGVYWWVAAIGVFVFAGLTAWDTQMLKQMYLVQGSAGNLAILGALHLYMDFVNIFLFLLRLFGGGGGDD
jgi:FtsH-binding integral membrane protein